MLFGFKDNKCKQEVYSKDEVDNMIDVQEYVTTKEHSKGTITSIFRRSGNVVNVLTKVNIVANGLLSTNFAPENLPEWAKTNQTTGIIATGSYIGNVSAETENDYYRVKQHLSVRLNKTSTGNHVLIISATNKEEETTDLYVTISYIVD